MACLKAWARSIKGDLIAIYFASRDPRVPWHARVLALCVAGYALSPIDLIPDFVPVLGYLDDVVILRARRPQSTPTRQDGERRYEDTEAARLRFIRHGRRLGFETDEFRAMLEMTTSGSCEEIDVMVRHIGERMTDIEVLDTQLGRAGSYAHCWLGNDPGCTVGCGARHSRRVLVAHSAGSQSLHPAPSGHELRLSKSCATAWETRKQRNRRCRIRLKNKQ